MSILPEHSVEQSGPSGGGPFSWPRMAIWLPGVLISAAVAARVAIDAQSFFAPLLIFPLLVGIGLGGLLIALMRIAQVGNRPTIILGLILAVSVCIVGQHYICYLSGRSNDAKQLPLLDRAMRDYPELAAKHLPNQSKNFSEYLRNQADRGRPLLLDYSARGWVAWLTWAIDGLLTLAGSAAVVIPTMLLPFCGQCQTWYRAIRSAHIPPDSITQVGRIVGVEPVEHLKGGRCRLICCSCGCGLTGCELYWEDMTGETYFARVWIYAARRSAVMQLLDQVMLWKDNDENRDSGKYGES